MQEMWEQSRYGSRRLPMIRYENCDVSTDKIDAAGVQVGGTCGQKEKAPTEGRGSGDDHVDHLSTFARPKSQGTR
jgi:hypothetical protein